MKVVLDTNVFVSGIFFGGPPARILTAWQEGQIELIASVEILQEYERVCQELSAAAPGIDPTPFLKLVALDATLIEIPPLPAPVCTDSDDDKFLACALTAGSNLVISGDKQLLATNGYHGLQIIRPREFIDRYLTSV